MNQKKDTRNQKTYVTVGVITLVAVIALAGISYRKTASREGEEQEAVVMAEAEWTEDDEADGEADVAEDSSAAENASKDSSAAENVSEESGDNDADFSDDGQEEGGSVGGVSDGGQTEDDSVEGKVSSGSEDADTVSLSFSEADRLSWPLQGDVILNYSMDQSVYFATLDQYKYNPALVIAGEVNDPVTAAAAGQVISVETSEETGETVAMEIGGGYQLVYGQLKEIQASEGDYVAEGDLLGFVSEPTKYYSVEGSNLYFQMLKDGEPVNPLHYLKSSSAE
ncbi:MAG: peptidoglycan DD-metalloendopeptidase family protein [Lachnospiraceae bacterium]|nr:peptidoglycan DD-metalloendopeptidase family protein [Lachnospiraceae bacterium]